MILTALKELAEREGLVDDPDYEPKGVHYLVKISRDGRIAGFTSTLSPPASGRGKPRPKKLSVPRHSGRTSGATAEFFCDKAEYVFGIDPQGKREATELSKRRNLFLEKVNACAVATQDEAVVALSHALTKLDHVRLPDDVASNSLFAFIYEPDVDRLVSDRESVHEYWRQIRQQSKGKASRPSTRCLITGEAGIPTDKHPSLKRVPGATTSGAALVSFNADAFESYGLKRNENAAISRTAAEAYTTALNRLLDSAYPSPADGTPMPRRNLRLNDATVVVFWSREASTFVDLFASVVEANDPESVRAAFAAPHAGRSPVIEDPQEFYAAILSGAQGRVVLREWIETTIRDVARNVRQHFDDLLISRPGDGTAPLPLWLLLHSVAVQGKKENVPPGLATAFFAAILRGTSYPRALLDASVRRMRAEQAVTPQRAALIKAYLLRARRLGSAVAIPEVTMSLDQHSLNVPYRLGRLFAVLERLQEAAVRPSATIRDRFFGAASANPVTVFPRLIRGAQPHISKISAGSYFQKMIGDVLDGLPASTFPASLSLEEQGLFALGYYHQRQAFFTKNAPHADAKAE